MEALSQPASRRRTREEVQAAVQTGLVELLAERAFNDVTIDELARRAGLSRTAFYFYYPDKNEVLKDAAESVAAEIYAEADRWWHGSGPPEQLIREALAGIANVYCNHGDMLRAAIEVTTYDPEIRAFYWGCRPCPAARRRARGGVARVDGRALRPCVLLDGRPSPRRGDRAAHRYLGARRISGRAAAGRGPARIGPLRIGRPRTRPSPSRSRHRAGRCAATRRAPPQTSRSGCRASRRLRGCDSCRVRGRRARPPGGDEPEVELGERVDVVRGGRRHRSPGSDPPSHPRRQGR
jgi:AcrR family transcriptional regulator